MTNYGTSAHNVQVSSLEFSLEWIQLEISRLQNADQNIICFRVSKGNMTNSLPVNIMLS